jgi:23S rRNA (guanine745-N1)-methyltransferase
MLDDVLGYLRCPICRGDLIRAGGSVRCTAGHSFDIARQGYVSLLGPGTPKNAGDTAAMVRARNDFLAAGHFAALAAAVADAAEAAAGGGGCVVDVGAGTGYYLAAVLARLPRHAGLALDLSRYALRLAARAHARAGAVGCDAWRALPVADGAADLVLNVFAPRDGAELARILRPGGCLLVVTPARDHLAELIGPLGLLSVDRRKQQRLSAKLGPYLDLAGEAEHRRTVLLDRGAVGALTAMGPSSWHADPAVLAARIAGLPDPVPVTVAVTLSVFRKRR